MICCGGASFRDSTGFKFWVSACRGLDLEEVFGLLSIRLGPPISRPISLGDPENVVTLAGLFLKDCRDFKLKCLGLRFRVQGLHGPQTCEMRGHI